MKKYRQGARIDSFEDFLKQEFIFFRGKPVHQGWFRSWSIHYTSCQIKNGLVFKAEKITEGEHEG